MLMECSILLMGNTFEKAGGWHVLLIAMQNLQDQEYDKLTECNSRFENKHHHTVSQIKIKHPTFDHNGQKCVKPQFLPKMFVLL